MLYKGLLWPSLSALALGEPGTVSDKLLAKVQQLSFFQGGLKSKEKNTMGNELKVSSVKAFLI